MLLNAYKRLVLTFLNRLVSFSFVLVWGQMSYWAATVITNLLRAIPMLGAMLVEWVWGGFAVSNQTFIDESSNNSIIFFEPYTI